jgi:ferrous iron transport protein B
MPTPLAILMSMWERGWSFVKRAGSVILIATVVVWFLSGYGFQGGKFAAVYMNNSLLATIGHGFDWLFSPLGWGDWRAAVATITGLVAKENVVGTFGVLFNSANISENGNEIWTNLRNAFSPLAAYSFLIFNLLCAPCFAAMGAIRREMNSPKWFWIAVGYQTIFAYFVSFCVYQFGVLFSNGAFSAATIIAIIVFLYFVYLLFRSGKKHIIGTVAIGKK